MTGGDTSHAETTAPFWANPRTKRCQTCTRTEDALAAERAARQQAEEALRDIASPRRGHNTRDQLRALATAYFAALAADGPEECVPAAPAMCMKCGGVGCDWCEPSEADGPEATP